VELQEHSLLLGAKVEVKREQCRYHMMVAAQVVADFVPIVVYRQANHKSSVVIAELKSNFF
jgi:hypothetical protein